MVGVKRCDIWLVDLNPTRGSEQKGIRPCIIISNDLTNKYAPTVCAIPLTSNLDGKRFPINAILKKAEKHQKKLKDFFSLSPHLLVSLFCHLSA
ncbi:type II toxin-antitoxin system PemK/MazF family toxin [candidate division KSB1 bacterium]|nr:type II toxin-antitoxin system PemK/MazF family toxin [candidate division KSB1 bacterium]